MQVGSQFNGHTGPLRFSAFVPAQAVNQYLSESAGQREALELFQTNKISKVYLDCLRGGHFPGEDVLITARDLFIENGLKVSAGLTPTRGTGKASTHGRWWLCYTNKRTQEELEQVVRRTALLFDEIIVDDFLCTHCQCAECRAGRGERSWSEYYRDLLVKVAQDCIIAPSKAENPRIRVIIKYPQWYDRFHAFGYDVRQHPRQFDEVWVGTEIRDPRVEYVHQYQAFANYRWLASISGEKIGGAWFDFINCYPEIYVEQAVQSILAGARELVRFHYEPDLYSPENPNTRVLLNMIPQLEELVGLLDGCVPQGIAFYKPPDTDGEDEAYLSDYLGMLGLPMVPYHVFPHDAQAVCLPLQAAADLDVVDNALTLAAKGTTIMLTPGFLEKLAGDERLLRLAGYANPPVTAADLWTFRFSVQQAPAPAESHIHFGANLHPVSAEVLATGIHPSGNFPVLTRNKYENGKVLVFNAKTFRYSEGSGRVTVAEPVSLPKLPQKVVDILRAEMLSNFPVDVQAPSRVGVYWYSNRLILTNFNDQSVEATVSLKPSRTGPAEDAVSHRMLGDWLDGKLTFGIPGRRFAVI
ncbi:TPA: hypothetical protein EYP66_04545 [Candidatus Poribacteria bacterium]|nr:hypothetical protein [Candidatus Poribacteria bacterium]